MAFDFAFVSLVLHWFALGLSATNYTDLVIEMGGDLQIASLAVAFRSILGFLTTPIWGSLSDSLGRKTVMLISALGFTVSFGIFGIFSSLQSVFFSSFIFGFSLGLPPAVQALIVDKTPIDKRQERLGTLAAMNGVGWMLGVPLGGILATNFGNHSPFLMASLISFGNAVCILLFLTSHEKKSKKEAGGVRKNLYAIVQLMSIPNVRELLIARMMQEISMGVMGACWNELLRSSYQLSAQLRGFLGMYMGILGTIIQAFITPLSEILGGPKFTVSTCFISLIGIAFLLPFSNSFEIFMALSTIWQLMSSFLLPLLNNMMTKNAPPSQQGALLGASESMISLGAVVGPLSTGYFYEINPQLPFFAGMIGFGIGLYAFLSQHNERRISPQTIPKNSPKTKGRF